MATAVAVHPTDLLLKQGDAVDIGISPALLLAFATRPSLALRTTIINPRQIEKLQPPRSMRPTPRLASQPTETLFSRRLRTVPGGAQQQSQGSLRTSEPSSEIRPNHSEPAVLPPAPAGPRRILTVAPPAARGGPTSSLTLKRSLVQPQTGSHPPTKLRVARGNNNFARGLISLLAERAAPPMLIPPARTVLLVQSNTQDRPRFRMQPMPTSPPALSTSGPTMARSPAFTGAARPPPAAPAPAPSPTLVRPERRSILTTKFRDMGFPTRTVEQVMDSVQEMDLGRQLSINMAVDMLLQVSQGSQPPRQPLSVTPSQLPRPRVPAHNSAHPPRAAPVNEIRTLATGHRILANPTPAQVVVPVAAAPKAAAAAPVSRPVTHTRLPRSWSSGPRRCSVCAEAECNMVMVPCGHCCTCAKCAEAIMKDNARCPICRNVAQHPPVRLFVV